MRASRWLTIAVLALALAACDSATDPGDGGGGDAYSLAGAFPADVAEFIDETTAGRLRFQGIEFASGTATLTAAHKQILDGFAEVFDALPGARYSVEAHTDERGTAASNRSLTQAQAEAVRDYLIEQVGGPGPYITAIGYGEDQPLDTGSSAAAWALNRRVEIVVTYRDGPMTRFVLEARQLNVVLDCDANPEPGVDQPGDFQITVSVRVSNASGFYVMDEVKDYLVTANDGETLALDLAADAAILPVTGDIIEVYVGFDEWDGGTSYNFRRSQLFQFEYLPDLDCYGRLYENACGVVESGVIAVHDNEVGGGPCEVSLEWGLRLVRVP